MTDMNFASLSPALLARKGGAKPAMRRQSPMGTNAVTGAHPSQPGMSEAALEDLGWNDLGDEHAETVEAAPGDDAEETSGDETQFAKLDRHAASTSAEDVSATKVTPIHTKAPRLPRPRLAASNPTGGSGNSQTAGKRTAFTLRLDAERHLKLRMASTLAGRSAQALVTEAVDAMFAQTPELDALVARAKSRPHKEG